MWWMCCRERPEPTAARALTADQWANQAGMGGAMGTPRQAVATGAVAVKDGRREGEAVASAAGQEGQDRRQPQPCFKPWRVSSAGSVAGVHSCSGHKIQVVVFTNRGAVTLF